MTADQTPQAYFTPRQTARYIGVTVRTLTEWRRVGGGPAFVRLGLRTGRVRYSKRELDNWMAQRQHAHTAAELKSTAAK